MFIKNFKLTNLNRRDFSDIEVSAKIFKNKFKRTLGLGFDAVKVNGVIFEELQKS